MKSTTSQQKPFQFSAALRPALPHRRAAQHHMQQVHIEHLAPPRRAAALGHRVRRRRDAVRAAGADHSGGGRRAAVAHDGEPLAPGSVRFGVRVAAVADYVRPGGRALVGNLSLGAVRMSAVSPWCANRRI